MPLWTADEIAQALKKENIGKWQATGVSIDSRTLKAGDLFVALKGDQGDGHDFVAQALAKGAVAALVNHLTPDVDNHFPQILVPDTLVGLCNLAQYARGRTNAKIFAITGSVGKTSSKEALRHVCEVFGSTAYSQASYNNHWGAPLSLARMERDADFGVFELGMNHKGEIAPLTQLVRPHIAMITGIAEAHRGQFSSAEEIADAKAEIFLGLEKDKVAILNRDDALYDYLAKAAQSHKVNSILSFGRHPQADARLVSLTKNNAQSQVTAFIGEKKISYTLKAQGDHTVLNSLMILAASYAAGFDLEKAAQRLETVQPIQGRGQQHRLNLADGGSVLLIDDAYNANPTSMRAGLAVLAEVSPHAQGRRVAVLGDMLELGENSAMWHRDLADVIEGHKIDLVLTSGTEMQHLYNALPPSRQGGYAQNAEALIPQVCSILKSGDVIFVKGSKGSYVSKVVDYLLKTFPPTTSVNVT